MKRAAALALILLAALLWWGKRERPPEQLPVTLPMPEASRRTPASAGLVLKPVSRPPAAAQDLPREPAVSAPASAPRVSAASPEVGEDKASLLDEMLRARNDNDPRLESAFNGLPLATRRVFREKYRRLPPEKHNQRGTIVYLLGKNLAASEDWAFLREVAGEPPCLSLADCAKAAPDANGTVDAGDEVTLAYPALVALVQAERVLAEKSSAESRREALAVVRAGKSSAAPAVAEMAAQLEKRF